MKKLIYPGYMSKKCSEFFGDSLINEERDGCGVVGYFIKLENGNTIMPSKGDIFFKDENGKLKLV